jgi:hypothetical protein
VLADNVGMLRVFHRAGHAIESRLVDGTYELTIMFDGVPGPSGPIVEPPATAGEATIAAPDEVAAPPRLA